MVNLTQRPLSETEHETEQRALGLGLNFALAPKQLPILDVINGVEQGLSIAKLPDDATDIRIAVLQALLTAERPTSNLKKEEIHTIRILRSDKSVVILLADKDNVTVKMDRDNYDHKIDSLLSDQSYSRLRCDHTKKIER